MTTAILCGMAFSQTKDEIGAQLDAVNEQIVALRHENMRSPEAERLSKKVKSASDAYKNAIEVIPGIKTIDAESKVLRKEMMELNAQKEQLIKSNKSALQDLKQDRENASEELRYFVMGGKEGEALRTEQLRLMKKANELKNPEEDKKPESDQLDSVKTEETEI